MTLFAPNKLILNLGIVFLLTICIHLPSTAQDAMPLGIELNVMGGQLFKHTKNFRGPIPPFSGGMELNFIWKSNGRRAWQQRRHYPSFGIGTAFNFYDRYYYGQSIGIYPMLELPILKRNHWDWTIRFGMGLGYVNKHYRDYPPYWDTVNNAMGAAINNFSLLSSDLRYTINNKLQLQAGITFSHMSSGKFKLPNLGINFIGGHIGCRYYPNTWDKPLIKTSLSPLKQRFLVQAKQGFGMSTGESIGSANTPVIASSVALSRRYWSHNKIWLGLDYAYHQSVYDFQRLQAIHPGDEKKYSWNLGLFVGHEFLFGRCGLNIQLGTYLHQTILPKAPIYQRYGMNWYLLQAEKGWIKEWYMGTFLKTHFATAEYAELSMGFGF